MGLHIERGALPSWTQRRTLTALLYTVLGAAPLASAAETPVQLDYNKHIRPILAEHCFKCHGVDAKQRKGQLRLDVREAALEKKSIVPGAPDESELLKRILTTVEDDVMPPVKERKKLSAEQTETLRRWIAEGAAYKEHWAFIPPVKTPVPAVRSPLNTEPLTVDPIDAFVLQHLSEHGLQPAPPAPKEAWLRRVTLDLTGLPPTLQEIDAFLADTSSAAFENVVDRLLAAPTYGERMASEWLDVARYADTYGRHDDTESTVWPYRDWVVRAFNQNLPYDRFITEQTAGDMLPDATQDSYLATTFNRLVQQSDESGSNEEEFRCEHVADRMRTNGIAFLGLSLECARCHDHKYDPITQRDYYAMSAFLSNVDELGLYSRFTQAIPAPSLLIYQGDAEQRHLALKLQMAQLEHQREALRDGAGERFRAWLATGGRPVAAAPVVHLPLDRFTGKVTTNLCDARASGHVRRKPDSVPGRLKKGMALSGDNWVSVGRSPEFNRTQPFSVSIWAKVSELPERAVIMHHSRAGVDAASRGWEVLLESGKVSFTLAHFYPGNAVRVRTAQSITANEWTHLTVTYDGSSRAAGLK
ncbi:MAG: DUF1549 domain-containing protein, partial [Roseimicrobium sp.]